MLTKLKLKKNSIEKFAINNNNLITFLPFF